MGMAAGQAVICFCAVDIADGWTVVVYGAVGRALLAGAYAMQQREG